MEKKPYIAALLSFIYPGIGIIYAGRTFLGILTTAITTMITIPPLIFLLSHKPAYFGFLEIITLNRFSNHLFVLYWGLLIITSYMAVQLTKIEKKEGKVGIIDQDAIICPECLYHNEKGAEKCANCGKNLKVVLLYSGESLFPDVEITHTKIIEYQKNFWGKRNGEKNEYLIKNIRNYDLIDYVKSSFFHSYLYQTTPSFIILTFEYDFQNGYIGRKEVYIRDKKINDLKKVFELKKIAHREFIEL